MIHLLVSLFLQPAFAKGPTCCTFPTFEKPTYSYQESPRKFSANRSGGRLHAACDLYQTAKDQGVRSIQSGRVLRDLYYFYQGTYALELKHNDGTVVRYGEMTGQRPPGFDINRPVQIGQTIGYIGKVSSNCCDPMLHFEQYQGTRSGPLTQPRANRFQRRADLIDPTQNLLHWESRTFPPNSPIPSILMAPALSELKYWPHPIPNEQISTNKMLGALLLVENSNLSPKDLVIELSKQDIPSKTTSNTNAETGEMVLVQSLPANSTAHHFHAQYFGDGDSNYLLQHISFEIRPGIKSLQDLIDDIKTRAPNLGEPDLQTSEFVQWQLKDDRILWIKILNKEDLQENPFYEYSLQDIGTLRVAIELDHE